MARHQDSADALVNALQFKHAKSPSGRKNHKVRALKERDGIDDEDEEQETETQ